ncbi:MAG: hypothetical protein CVU36_04695 [Betaproteobacteria bacterium HGW-Betaproteobacteria-9]|jgi:type IV fimbrial biogenesis protein FimT|nr:MAG: hypothetical protein CVU36_04695 [Betaproteobacteria bacterium HGW-Betaproteobacteria-9]
MQDTTRGRIHGGFTLVEFLVTISVLGLLLSLALPSFAQMLANWQRDRATKALTTHLRLSRTLAIKSTRHVVLCNSIDGDQCSLSDDMEWKSGWIVFQDLNQNNQRDTTETIVASAPSLQGILSLSSNIKAKRFVFKPSGIMASGMSTLRVVPRTGQTQKITLSRIGRVRLSMEKDS